MSDECLFDSLMWNTNTRSEQKLLDELTRAIDTDGVALDSSKMTAFIQRVSKE